MIQVNRIGAHLRLGGSPVVLPIAPMPADRNGAQESHAAAARRISPKDKGFFPNRADRRIEKIYFGPPAARGATRSRTPSDQLTVCKQ
ncbi:MAG: hypothetical protein Q8P46_07550 [Hyphomicrobiales bacterium]|nr:hypothetical protein [Hyphomicrobiales bacterium]